MAEGTGDKRRELLEPLKQMILKLKALDKDCAELEYSDNNQARMRVKRDFAYVENELHELRRLL